MALIDCPECAKPVSEQAPTCPACGFPLRTAQARRSNGARRDEAEPCAGHIYILSNPAFGADLYKIGKTTRTPEERVRELSGHTGVPEGFTVEFSRWVTDCHEAEAMVHGALKKYRENASREFFRVLLDRAIKVVEAICSTFDEEAPGTREEDSLATVTDGELSPASTQDNPEWPWTPVRDLLVEAHPPESGPLTPERDAEALAPPRRRETPVQEEKELKQSRLQAFRDRARWHESIGRAIEERKQSSEHRSRCFKKSS